MVSEARNQSMAPMETDYSKHTYFRWKVKWRLEHLGALGTMGETVLVTKVTKDDKDCFSFSNIHRLLKHVADCCLLERRLNWVQHILSDTR